MIERANKDFHENRKEFLGICWQDLQKIVIRVYIFFEEYSWFMCNQH